MALTDLEEIQQNVVEPRTRVLVAEVIKCYEVGAYRAALVALWITVVTDLTYKIRHLSDTGDGYARERINELETALKNKSVRKVQEFERKILDISKEKLELITSREYTELKRLYEDRNLCAHPSFVEFGNLFLPDAEMVRAHIVAACRSLFSQRPIAGKRLLSLLKSEIQGHAWPGDGSYLLDRYFRNSRLSVQRNITKVLIKSSIQLPLWDDEEAKRDTTTEKYLKAAYTVAEDAPQLFENTLESVLHNWEKAGVFTEQRIIRAVGSYGARSSFWSALPKTGKDRLLALLNSNSFDLFVDEGLFLSGKIENQDLAEEFEGIISELDREQLGRAIKLTHFRTPFVQHAIAKVKKSESFQVAEANLRLVQLCSSEMTAENVRQLHAAFEENTFDQPRRAAGTESILRSIYEESSNTHDTKDAWVDFANWLYEAGIENDDPECCRYERLHSHVQLSSIKIVGEGLQK